MRPKCPVCKEQLSKGASINGKAKFFCITNDCPDRFKTISDPTPILPETHSDTTLVEKENE